MHWATEALCVYVCVWERHMRCVCFILEWWESIIIDGSIGSFIHCQWKMIIMIIRVKHLCISKWSLCCQLSQFPIWLCSYHRICSHSFCFSLFFAFYHFTLVLSLPVQFFFLLHWSYIKGIWICRPVYVPLLKQMHCYFWQCWQISIVE